MMHRLLVFIQHPAMQTALLNVYTECVRRPEFHRCLRVPRTSRVPSTYNEPEMSALGTPVLFCQMSTSSL